MGKAKNKNIPLKGYPKEKKIRGKKIFGEGSAGQASLTNGGDEREKRKKIGSKRRKRREKAKR